ncbi:GntR family transcriptional regulator [Thalassotalea sp. PLHSN55]|uniref:GntR family transcriptional regulator n=1 Tax=Thalassotalea sp. PLHSN55 TaxID=3435888 RepID=UPI003F834B81
MNEQSYLIQETVNGILNTLTDFDPASPVLLKDNTLAKQLDVSRTTIRTALLELEQKGIISIIGSQKTVLRSAQQSDFFDMSNSVATKEELIERYFLNLINQGKLLPGDKFSELELAKSSGCNTITVREFLIKFSRFGLIEKKPRAKWQMVKFDEKFAIELVEFRRVLEMNAVTKLLATPSEDAIWAELSSLLDRHVAVLGDLPNRQYELKELDRQFHHIIQKASDNRFYTQFFDIVSLICHYHYQWDDSDFTKRCKVILDEHIAILTNLLTHNTSGVISAMESHLNTAQAMLLRSVASLK